MLKFVKGSYGIHKCIYNPLFVEKEINNLMANKSNLPSLFGNGKSCDLVMALFDSLDFASFFMEQI